MIRKTAQRRTDEFTSKSNVVKFFGKDYILSAEIKYELLDFWTKWLDDNPTLEPNGPVYDRLCNFIKSGELDFYKRYRKIQTLKSHTLQQYQILFGVELGTVRYNNRNSRISNKSKLQTTDEKIDAFCQLKNIKDKIAREELSHDQLSELSQLFDAFEWNSFKEIWSLILDLVKFHYPNYIKRYQICINNHYTSEAYLLARFGNNQDHLKYLEIKKSNQGKNSFANCTEYWTSRGFDYDAALEQVKIVQTSRSKRAGDLAKEDLNRTPRQIGYWVRKGYSDSDAKQIISNLQRRDLEFFVLKYGCDDGYIRYQKMLDSRKETWYARSNEERDQINETRGRTFNDLVEMYGKTKAIEIIVSRASGNCGVSKESVDFFIDLDQLLGEELAEKSVTGYKGSERFVITNNGIIFVDYYLDGKIVEYFGSFWHADPRLFTPDKIHSVVGLRAEEMWLRDKNRIDSLNNLGYKVLVLWSTDVNQDRESALINAKEFLLG